MSDMSAPFTIDKGTLLGDKYIVLEPIGFGGMGSVYLARHKSLQRRFAIKFLRRDKCSGKRFAREARIAGALEHDNIVAVIDTGIGPEQTPYLVMEYLDGFDLGAILKKEKTLSVEKAVELMLQACYGLDHAHALGIVHRDMKPSNLYVCRRSDGRDHVKVLDFGIAKWTCDGEESFTRTGSTLGSPNYMAPEQARGEKGIDARADVFALGAILYEALSGSKAHDGDNYHAIVFHLLHKEPVPLSERRPDLPQALCAAVHSALSKDRSERPSDVRAWVALLASHGRGTATSFYQPLPSVPELATLASECEEDFSKPSESVRAPGRRASRWGLLVVVGGLMLAGLLVALQGNWRSPVAPVTSGLAGIEDAPVESPRPTLEVSGERPVGRPLVSAVPSASAASSAAAVPAGSGLRPAVTPPGRGKLNWDTTNPY
jgi:serine/threonine-protein kinase